MASKTATLAGTMVSVSADGREANVAGKVRLQCCQRCVPRESLGVIVQALVDATTAVPMSVKPS